MHAVACQRIQVAGEGRDRVLPSPVFISAIFMVQHHAAYQLNIEVTHLQHPPASLAHRRKSFGQNF